MTSDDSVHPLCPKCLHILRGISEPRCPECGRKISAEDFADLSRLIPGPPWERRRERGRVRCFVATIYQFLIHPRRFFRSLNSPATVHGAIAYWIWLIPVAWIFSLVLYVPVYVVDSWRWQDRTNLVDTACVLGIRTTAFLLTGVAVSLPMLIAIDLLLWRQRRQFHILARAVVYSMTWWFAAAAILAGVGNWGLCQLARTSWSIAISEWIEDYIFMMGWEWGEPPFHGGLGGYWPEVYVPWICWIAALIVTIQCFVLIRQIHKLPVIPLGRESQPRPHLRWVVAAGWLVAVYLLLIDRYICLRFHLQFAVNELRWICDGVNAWFEGSYE